MAVTGIDHVQVAAPRGCEQAAREFYGALIGMPEIPKPEELQARGGVWFRAGTQELHIGVEEPFAPAKKAHPGLLVDNLHEVRRLLQAAGHEPQDDTAIPGVERLFVTDPFGNRLELQQV